VKALALARDPGEEAVAASRPESHLLQLSLDARPVRLFQNGRPNTSLAAGLNEFLRYIVSQEGQRLCRGGH